MAVLRTWLAGLSADATASLEEGGKELLTLRRLGITSELHKSIASTNMVESLFSVVQDKVHRVKNWNGHRSNQTLRWVASAIIGRCPMMRRVRGTTQTADLLAVLSPRPLAATVA